MPYVSTADGTQIFYKDWGSGRPVVFSHGWPLNADAWDNQLHLAASHGLRAIAHDRRGHGRSGQPWHGNDMDTYADDLATLLSRPTPTPQACPSRSSTPSGPGSRPTVPGSTKELAVPFYGFNREGAQPSQGVIDAFWLWSMQAGVKGALDYVKAFSETDFTHDLQNIDVPTLVVHGDDDQIMPIGASAPRSAELLKDATLKVYPGAPHGLSGAFEQAFNDDLLSFVTS
ncbi:alpha/beta fold hydrolase [Planobispora takensis]|uniref:Alpha/beta hydrolase n=1 Tax=Planobispora takensis TaxID=1367882 RepID=A0A8J3WXA3_9ACTN|nr:alpha/beta hydrolase [Planobispora takensis]GII05829.1 alpha/beta hydrolase [Planobispora takensis]